MATFDATGRLEPLVRVLDRFVADGAVDGAAIAVAVGGEQVAEYHVGLAHAPEGRAATTDTLWPLASISKLYTAAAVMSLVEQGLLTLSTTARSVLPGFEGEGRESITLRHLLTHTSGLIYESPEMLQRLIDNTPIDQLIDEAYGHALMFPPGTRLSYSDYGLAIAGRMASVASGMAFPELIRALVLEPGQLADTFMPPPRSEYHRLAWVVGPLAEGTDGAMYNSPYALDLAHPAFGTVSTVSDLLRFGLLFAPKGGHRLHSEAAIRVMTTDATGGHVHGSLLGVESPAPIPWGIGFMVKGEGGPGADLVSPSTFSHGGASGCTLQIDPVNDIAVAYVSNRHANTGREPFMYRLSEVVNVAVACLTRRAD